MAILNAQAWSSAVNADGQSVFGRQKLWDATHSAARFEDTRGPFGNGAWTSGLDNQTLRLDGGFGLSTIFAAFWLNIRVDDNTVQNLHLVEGAFTTLHVYMENAFGSVVVKRGNGTELGRSTKLQARDRWYHMAIKAVIHDTTGSVEVRVDNEVWILETGLDTRNGGTSGIIDSIRYEGWSGNRQWIAEPIVWSGVGDAPTDFFGPHRVHMIKPDGDGTPTNFTPLGAGTNFSEVDEQAADDDTSHNESTVVTNKDRLTCESLPAAVKTVYSVQAKLLVKDPDGTATESVKIGLNSGTESLGSAEVLSTGYEQFEGPMETVDPNTAAAWTEANVNAADVVYEHA